MIGALASLSANSSTIQLAISQIDADKLAVESKKQQVTIDALAWEIGRLTTARLV